ncbi:MAG TPA: hypothetical protein DDW52_13830 [Planctomycetaceae bacterium]|nr:hypothetical protein [Planctomycetaceae bacterium]
MQSDPVAFFITFTIYGTYLQGDGRWWRSRRDGFRSPQPMLEQWHRDRLKHDVLLLNEEQRAVAENEVFRLSDYRAWYLWAVSFRSNHAHLVVTAPGLAGAKVRDQVKANCTRVLRERWKDFRERPVWSVGGDWKIINSEDSIASVVAYVVDAQDRKGADENG